jgi:uroporphyrinogen-III decarboxylase
MHRQFFLDLAEKKAAIPLAADLLVHALSHPEHVESDSEEMARVMHASVAKFRSPLTVAPMDLRVEKRALGELLGIPPSMLEEFHLHAPLEQGQTTTLLNAVREKGITPRMEVTCGALQRVAIDAPSFPVGMCIGPFSLLTKLVEGMITAVFMISQGFEPEDDPSVALALDLLPVTMELVRGYAVAQVKAGAKAVIICEPAANKVYISPNVMESGSGIFSQFVLEPVRSIADSIEEAGAAFILHDCGELTPEMISSLASLRPSMLSLGSSVNLAQAASLVPQDVVLFGNVPSKFFPSDADMPEGIVREICAGLRGSMDASGHPYILGSECDILSVGGKEDAIMRKAMIISEFSGGGVHF